MRRVTLVVFGREDRRREWLKFEALAGRTVRFGEGVVTEGENVWIARTVQDRSDYQSLMGMELSDVIEHPSFVAPTPEWDSFIRCRVRLPQDNGLRQHVGDEDWERYTRAGEGCMLYGVLARDMTREELLVLVGFAATDWQNVRHFVDSPRE